LFPRPGNGKARFSRQPSACFDSITLSTAAGPRFVIVNIFRFMPYIRPQFNIFLLFYCLSARPAGSGATANKAM
jgi:hypothetical protein